MNELHTEDANALLVKQWWNKHGTALIAGLILVILAVSGHRFWVAQQAKIAAQASALYDQYQMALNTHDDEGMKATGNTLRNDYKRTPYATAVAMIDAARDVKNNQLDLAAKNLQWVIDQGHDYAKPIARLRLAELKLQLKDYEAAQALLQNPTEKAYVAPYQEMRGDIYFAQGKIKEAIDEYTKALESYKDLGFENILLQYKLQTYAPTPVAEKQ